MDSARVNDIFNQARLLSENSEFAELVSRLAHHCAGIAAPPDTPVVTTIDRNDQMLLHSVAEHRNAGAALAQYHSIGIQQHALLSQIIRRLRKEQETLRILDFACGHGRALRFMTAGLENIELHASEIQPDALDFIQSQLGINTIASTTHPSDFNHQGGFDLIWVASLFSHLPDGLFAPWLEKLLSMLTPTGMLCFSTKPMGDAGPDDAGFQYVGQSEVTPLDEDTYGTTHVSDRYVRQLVSRYRPDLACVRLDRCLAHEQDLYLVSGDASLDLSAFTRSLVRGTWGWLDIRKADAHGKLTLEGWAVSFDESHPLNHVRVALGGNELQISTGIPRPDVAEAFERPDFANCGWRCELRIDTLDSENLSVLAESDVYHHLIYFGPVDALTDAPTSESA